MTTRAACRALAAAWIALAAIACEEHPPPPPAATAPAASALVAANAAPPGPQNAAAESGHPANGADGKLHVWFFDVGQGDAVLIQGPTGKTVLIDGGPEDAGAHLSYRLPDLLHGPLDLVISTQPDPDHLGGLVRAISTVGARRFIGARTDAPLPQSRALMQWLQERGIQVFEPSVPPQRRSDPFRIALGGGAELQVLWPRRPAEPDLEADRPVQANSLVARLVYQKISILFGADMTVETERHLLASGFSLHSTLLKVPLHGAEGATTAALLEAVRPEAAVISVGAGNREGAPSHTVLARLEAAGAQVFRTDLNGEIRADSEGHSLVVVTERPAAGEAPETPHLFGARDTESGKRLAQSTVEEVRRRRPLPNRAVHADAPVAFGKVIEAGETHDGPFVASRNSGVFHLPSCRWAQRIKKKNLITFPTRSAALQSGRRPAGDCHP
ncbi:MAG: MBL fold metallo-hydrolase [Myxococcaceae bacterium]|nr:MBL fold metallo-hydrolase [Myxococcaceae bacterium]